MIQQTFYKIRHFRVNNILLIIIVGLTLFSCTPQVHVVKFRSVKNLYPPLEETDSVIIYKKKKDIPIDSKQIGTLSASCNVASTNCDSASVFSLAEMKIKQAGGNALVITKFEKPGSYWTKQGNLLTRSISLINASPDLLLNGDVFFVSDFSSPADMNESLYKTKLNSVSKKHLYIGFGIGQETLLSFPVPKICYYDFQDRKNFSTYYGIEGLFGSLLGYNAWYYLDCLYGIKKNIFTFDTSLGALSYPKQLESASYFHTTLNPKIGFKFGRVWIKGGPSIHLYKDYPNEEEKIPLMNMGKIGRTYFNFEILIN